MKINDVKTALKSKAMKVGTALACSIGAIMGVCHAEGEISDYSAATTALTSGLTGMKTEALTILGVVTGLAIVLIGGYFLIRLGLKWFKGLAK